jgi:hypothetical protein
MCREGWRTYPTRTLWDNLHGEGDWSKAGCGAPFFSFVADIPTSTSESVRPTSTREMAEGSRDRASGCAGDVL